MRFYRSQPGRALNHQELGQPCAGSRQSPTADSMAEQKALGHIRKPHSRIPQR